MSVVYADPGSNLDIYWEEVLLVSEWPRVRKVPPIQRFKILRSATFLFSELNEVIEGFISSLCWDALEEFTKRNLRIYWTTLGDLHDKPHGYFTTYIDQSRRFTYIDQTRRAENDYIVTVNIAVKPLAFFVPIGNEVGGAAVAAENLHDLNLFLLSRKFLLPTVPVSLVPEYDPNNGWQDYSVYPKMMDFFFLVTCMYCMERKACNFFVL